MNPECTLFQAELERALAGPSAALAELEHQAHARACTACRAQLVRERALARLLESVPAPGVPAALARRVLEGLARERSALRGTAPEGSLELSEHSEDDHELDLLLARVPAPRPPAGLAGRVLAGIAPVRRPRPVRSVRAGLLLGAALLLAALSLWAWAFLRRGAPPLELAQSPGAEPEVDEELLAYTVEHWELLHDEDLDVWLASLDPLDELLMEAADGQVWQEAEGNAGEQATTSDGGR